MLLLGLFVSFETKNPAERIKTHLTTTELQAAENYWIKVIQVTHFEADLDSLQRKQTPSNSSSLLSLQPFIDDSDVLRVGGRKQLSQTSSYQSRHPAILHGKHPLHMMNDDTTQTPYMQVLLYSYLDV